MVIVGCDIEDKSLSGIQSDILNTCAYNNLDYAYVCEILQTIEVNDVISCVMCFTKANMKCIFAKDLEKSKDKLVEFGRKLPYQNTAFFILDSNSNYLMLKSANEL